MEKRRWALIAPRLTSETERPIVSRGQHPASKLADIIARSLARSRTGERACQGAATWVANELLSVRRPRASPQLSQMMLAARWTAARKLRTVAAGARAAGG